MHVIGKNLFCTVLNFVCSDLSQCCGAGAANFRAVPKSGRSRQKSDGSALLV